MFIDYKCFWEHPLRRAYVQWITTNIIWALLVLLLIDSWIKDRDEIKEKENIIKQILFFDKIFSNYIKKQKDYISILINPENPSFNNLNTKCELKDLEKIFRLPSLHPDDNQELKLYEHYFINQNILIKNIKDFLINLDTKWFLEFENIKNDLSNYVKSAEQNNVYNNIDADVKWGRELENYIRKKLKTNIVKTERYININKMTPYLILLNNINYTIDFINNYEDLVKNLKK